MLSRWHTTASAKEPVLRSFDTACCCYSNLAATQSIAVLFQCMHGLLKVGRLPSYAAFGTSPRFTSRGPVGGPPVSCGRISCQAGHTYVQLALGDMKCRCSCRARREHNLLRRLQGSRTEA